jgi:predicted Rossmann fold nucleotide-binding protein DprA/Smf involved in DNA uptake
MRLNGPQEFLNFVDTIGPAVERLVVTVSAGTGEAAPAPVPARSPIGRRGPRGSKVNTTVLEALNDAPRTVKELKEALENAGMAAGSLSTSLATLQRSGQVERVGEGLYGLKMAKAAE